MSPSTRPKSRHPLPTPENCCVMVTGGAGFIGSYLANDLHSENYEVDVIDNLTRGDHTRLNKGINVYNVDLTEIDEMKILPKDYDMIFHLAAVNGTDNFYNNREKVFKVGFKSCVNIYDYFKNHLASKKINF